MYTVHDVRYVHVYYAIPTVFQTPKNLPALRGWECMYRLSVVKSFIPDGVILRFCNSYIQCIKYPPFLTGLSSPISHPPSCNIIKASCQEDWQLACNKGGKLRASGGSSFSFSWLMNVKNDISETGML